MKHFKRTKIIATLGPSVTGKIFSLKDFENSANKKHVEEAKRNIIKLIDNGVNIFRFNFSHGDYEEQLIRVKMVRSIAEEKGVNIALLLDTKGPEIRVGKFKNKTVNIEEKSKISILTNSKNIKGDEKNIPVYASSSDYFMEKDVKIGDPIYLDDGKLEVIVDKIDKENHIIYCTSKNSHVLKENKRINLPNAEYSMKFLCEKDINDIKFAIENKFDYIAASFVNSASNVKEIKEILRQNNAEHIQIISKIETMTSIKNIDEIIIASDAVMVARGDLGLEIPYYDVPYWEKYIIKACRFKGRPVIVATQMLDSLETKKQPTRAEVTDVFFAVERGADATMLSGETANGLYPDNAVDVMAKINMKSEELFDYIRSYEIYFKNTLYYKKPYGKKIIKLAEAVAPKREINNSEFAYDAIIVFSNNQEKIRALSNIRPACSIIVVSDLPLFKNYFSLNYAVDSYIVDDLISAVKNYENIVKKIIEKYNFKRQTITVIDDSIEEFKNK